MSKSKWRPFQSIPLQEKINFARHLSVATKSGLSLMDSLRLIQQQTPSKTLASVIDQLMRDVNNGQFLAESLEKYNHLFGEFFINIVRVGETSGSLSDNLFYLAQELKKQKEINQKVRSALIYPAVILVATIGITIFLTFFIFPKILPIFVSLKVALPLSTRILIAVLGFITQRGFIILAAVFVLIISIKFILQVKKIHYLFDRFLLSIPLVSNLIVDLTMVSFSRSLALLLKSGLTIVDALSITKGTFHNLVYRKEVDKIIENVKKGEQISSYLMTKPKLFPIMLSSMIRVGEETGNLQENLFYLSEYYGGEIDDLVKNLTVVLEPLLLMIMGLIVGFVAISIITPIYGVTQGL